ncbi:DUF3558 domain-containing protein [Actinopolyspora erythraea]|uniref:DUF3558 domain-containing protein n=1 Tax=Actinopolyspora erythraea TaxID=414996 RepID=A0A223RPB1_9ACTN|nr:DUF3558 family protein [Actinopolyspora erythraea]ASU77719.1 DUF3558 domain-containing protein [Actinopolyspora erythraea]
MTFTDPKKAKQRTPLAATATVLVALLTSCSSGQAQQDSQHKGKPPLADTQPCSTLTENQKNKLDITTPGNISELDEGTCRWKANGNNFNISIYKEKPLEKIDFSDAEAIEEIKVDKQDALLVKNNTGTGACSLAFAVTESSSVSVNSVADTPGDTETACDLVKKAAPMVERNISDS